MKMPVYSRHAERVRLHQRCWAGLCLAANVTIGVCLLPVIALMWLFDRKKS